MELYIDLMSYLAPTGVVSGIIPAHRVNDWFTDYSARLYGGGGGGGGGGGNIGLPPGALEFCGEYFTATGPDDAWCPGRPEAWFDGLVPYIFGYEAGTLEITVRRGFAGAPFLGEISVELVLYAGWDGDDLNGAVAGVSGFPDQFTLTIPAGANSGTYALDIPIEEGVNPLKALTAMIVSVNDLPFDAAGAYVTSRLQIAVIDSTMEAINDYRDLQPNTPITIGPGGNDKSGGLTYYQFWSDANLRPWVASFTQPAHGTVARVANPNYPNDYLLYTPEADYAGDDSFTYTATNGYQTDSATVYITGDPLVSVDDAEIVSELGEEEEPTFARFRVWLSRPAEQQTAVWFSTFDLPPNPEGSPEERARATPNGDYGVMVNHTVWFEIGEYEQWVEVPIVDDDIDEYDEPFGVELSGTAFVANAIALGTILDDDDEPELLISDTFVDEPTVGSVHATLTVTLSRMTEKDASVEFATHEIPTVTNPDAEVQPATSDEDYVQTQETMQIPHGVLDFPLEIDVLANGDDDWPLEAFDVSLLQAQNATPSTRQGRVTVFNPVVVEIWGNLSAYAPDTMFLRPLQIPEDYENMVGIRRNGDNDDITEGNNVADALQPESVVGENDLIRVDLLLNFSVHTLLQHGFTIHLKRENSAIQVWSASNRTGAWYEPGTTAFQFSADITSYTFYVEWSNLNHLAGPTSCNLEISATKNGQEATLDRLTFRPFNSLVVLFNGELQSPLDQYSGTVQIAQSLRAMGYDAQVFDEDDVGLDAHFDFNRSTPNADVIDTESYEAGEDYQGDPPWWSYKEIVRAVNSRGVKEVSIIGYSHGGGATFKLSERLENNFRPANNGFALKMTAYIDAVAKRSAFAETNRPMNSEFHLNLFQSGPGNLSPSVQLVQGGYLAQPQAGDIQDNVDTDEIGDDIYVLWPGLRHSNRWGPIGGRRGIAEDVRVQDTVLVGVLTKMSNR